MTQFSADTAVTAARAALWTWNAAEGAIDIRAEAGGPLASLDGRWMLEALLAQVDGLARTMISTRLAEGRPGDPIDVRVTLADGRPAHFVGSFHDLGVARGLIVSAKAGARLVHDDTNVEPVFQAIRHLGDLSVAGFEALARFRSPDGKLVGPDTLVGMGGQT